MHPATQCAPLVDISRGIEKEQGGQKRIALNEAGVPDNHERLRKRSQPQYQGEKENNVPSCPTPFLYRAYIARPQPATLLRVRQQLREDLEGHTMQMKKLGTPGHRCPPQSLPHAWRLDSVNAIDESSIEDDEWEESAFYDYHVTDADDILDDEDNAVYIHTRSKYQAISQLTHKADPWLCDYDGSSHSVSGRLSAGAQETDDCCVNSEMECDCVTVDIPRDCAIIAWGGGDHMYDRFFTAGNGKLNSKIDKDPFSYTYAKHLENMVR
ncbi:hypothetical protein SARC_10612 [Sphaeroforma arctica JP610]|uniref:Uncharacterized protein n=1 Tax=Sphaeroforma arctica JP610 TaxID=667725 RepID=A0A0L0FJG5_9EUKA|nr:hypothetical protein SARC_10612 [Sphaeroforma arctica JP610]KNC76910.1 hypothetical protein SARC_10612 [Sphaeroforma arctica JP610]|eukprot:XP_014150812.1 hypothetical protein SARC_10612 [Sphaeroforma arctica JP610]